MLGCKIGLLLRSLSEQDERIHQSSQETWSGYHRSPLDCVVVLSVNSWSSRRTYRYSPRTPSRIGIWVASRVAPGVRPPVAGTLWDRVPRGRWLHCFGLAHSIRSRLQRGQHCGGEPQVPAGHFQGVRRRGEKEIDSNCSQTTESVMDSTSGAKSLILSRVFR